MNYQEFKQAVIAKTEELGIAEYELYYQSGESISMEAFQHDISDFNASTEGGVCFRCIVNGKMGYASTEELSSSAAEAIVRRAAENAEVLEAEERVFLCEGGKTYAQIPTGETKLPGTDALRAKILETQEAIYAAHPQVVDGCQTQGFAQTMELAICNSKGLDLHYENAAAGLVAVAVVSDGQEKANDYQLKIGNLDTIDTKALAAKAAESAAAKLGNEVAPTGTYPVVFDPDAMSSLLSTFSGIFSAEAVQKGLSRLAGREGQQIASEAVTLVDDPFHPDNPMPMAFDAEGSPTYRKNVIEQGRLNTLLHNMKTAYQAGTETTGNGSKAGYAASVGIRPFTMYLAPGELTEEQLLQKAGSGVYINSLGGLHAGANPVTGDFSLQSAGFMIEDGKKTTFVKSFTVAGNFYDLLQSITAVADNVQLPFATGATAFGSPSVLVKALSVAGK